MADLPTRQREAVALRDFLGLSYEEVASTLSVSVPVVESLLFRARRRLRDTVRTVPRYAAGVAVVPLALRASVAREIPDFDSMRVGAGLVAGTAAAVAAGIAKLISIPFAGKAATAVAVATASTVVGPLFNGPAPPSDAGVAAPAIAEFSGGGPAEPEAAAPSEPAEAHAVAAPAVSEPPPATEASAPPALTEPKAEATVEVVEEVDSDRMSAESAAADGSLDLSPVAPVACAPAEAKEEFEDALEANDAEVLGDAAAVGAPCAEETGASVAEEPAPAPVEPAAESTDPAGTDEAGDDPGEGEEPADEPEGDEGSAGGEEVDDGTGDAAEHGDDPEQVEEEPAEAEAEAEAPLAES